MFYANNEQVKGIFLNGRNYNYLTYGFSKIIPEDRSSVQLNLNLAHKYLNKYLVEFGTVKDGYDNALVSPRFDNPDSNGIFHTPFTYYYNGNIISTKEVPVLITDGNYALRNALVYNDMNINGAINYFATNTDFQGHNVNVFKEAESFQVYQALLNYEMLNNCSNFDLNIETRFSKATYPTLNNCNNFSGNFRYVGNQDYNYPGFRGFLYECKDGAFNIDCTNMHGGGSDANVTNFYNFSGIQSCENMNVNITGSSWQAWAHPSCYSSNCNITTRYIVPGFDRMNHCNFNIQLLSNAEVEKSAFYPILSNSYNCNVYFDGTNSNLYSFRNNDFKLILFEDLNNCNLNLALSNSTGIDFSLGNRLNNCNIQFNHMNIAEQIYLCWGYMNNCNITGNVINAECSTIDLVSSSTKVNLNINASLTNNLSLVWKSSNINGNAILGNVAYVRYSNNLILNLYNGSILEFQNVNDSKFKVYNCNDLEANTVGNSYFSVNNVTFSVRNANDTEIYSDSSASIPVSILGADNCYNLTLSGLTFKTPDSDSLFENIYNSNLKFGTVNPYYRLLRATNCHFDGFPRALTYVKNCVFRPFNMSYVAKSTSSVGTWDNLWPHITLAGIRSINTIENCRVEASGWGLDGSITFNKASNMQTPVGTYYNGIVTANLPTAGAELNVDCNTLNLGLFQTGSSHSFERSSISANDIYANNIGYYCVQIQNDTRLYCENFCNAPLNLRTGGVGDGSPVMLINNYWSTNSSTLWFHGGLARIGRLNFQGGRPADLTLIYNTCVFINNALLGSVSVSYNSLLFLGSNVKLAGSVNVEYGGRIRNASNLTADDISFIDRGLLCWNLWDSGPWGSQTLFDYCTNV